MIDFEAHEQPDERPCPACGASPSHLQKLISTVSSQADRISKLEQEIAELKRRLSLYENSNSPPSKNSLLYREMRDKRREERQGAGGAPAFKKPGRKDGHEGVTQIFKPTGQVVHSMERCPRCDSTELVVTRLPRGGPSWMSRSPFLTP